MPRRDLPKKPRPFLAAGPRVSLPLGNLPALLAYYAVGVGLGTLAGFGCLLTAFDFPLHLPVLLPLGAGIVLLCTAQALQTRRRWITSLVLWGVWGLLLRELFPLVYQGAIRGLNVLFAGYSERLNFQLPALSLPVGAVTDRTASVTALVLFLVFPVAWLLSRMMVHRGGALGPFCVTGLLVLVPLGFSILPAAWAIGAMLLYWAFLLLSAPSLRTTDGPDRSGRFSVGGQLFARPASLLLLPIVALALLGIYRLWPPETYVRPQLAEDVRNAATQVLNLPALFRGGTGSGGNSVDLYALGSREFTGQTVLQVRHSWTGSAPGRELSPTARKDYLKSFVGSVYTGGSWERPDPQDAQAGEELFAQTKLHAQTLYAALETAFPGAEAQRQKTYTLGVKKINVDPRSIFSPYGLVEEDLPSGVGFREDGCLASSGWLAGPGEYTLSAVTAPVTPQWIFSRVYSHLLAQVSVEGEAVVYGSDETQAALYGSLVDALTDNSVGALDHWTVPQELRESFTVTQRRLMDLSHAYSGYVYDHYTQLPEETRAFARSYLSAHGLSPDSPDTDRFLLVERIRELLSRENRYELSPAPVPPGQDFVRTFLETTREGYCVHFASAAVVLLRAAGIPARYAEGYAVPVRPDPQNAQGQWLDVPDYNAHAWVEIFTAGDGWQPVEVTPPGPDAPAATANATAPTEEDLVLPTPRPRPTVRPRSDRYLQPLYTPTPVPVVPTPAPNTPEARQEETRSAMGGLALGILALLLPFALLGLIRQLRLAWRRAQFAQPDRNRAALAVYAHLLRLYRANNDLPYGGFEPPEELHELAQKARFSQHTLTREELARLTDHARQLEQRLAENLSPWPRRRWKWLHALF